DVGLRRVDRHLRRRAVRLARALLRHRGITPGGQWLRRGGRRDRRRGGRGFLLAVPGDRRDHEQADDERPGDGDDDRLTCPLAPLLRGLALLLRGSRVLLLASSLVRAGHGRRMYPPIPS